MKQQPQCTTKPDNEMTLEELKEELVYLRTENAVLKSWKSWSKKKAVTALTLKGKYLLKYLLHTLPLAKKCLLLSGSNKQAQNSY
ncbi:hypothetical protein AB4538_00255 [Vibrio lentus]